MRIEKRVAEIKAANNGKNTLEQKVVREWVQGRGRGVKRRME